MSDRPRPASLRRGPAPSTPPSNPDEITVVFHFEHGGSVPATLPVIEAARVHETVGRAWDRSSGQGTFAVNAGNGRGVLINLSKVRAVEIQ